MTDPYKKFNQWFNEVENKKTQDPTAFALGTSDKKNQPYIRMVLLKKGGPPFFLRSCLSEWVPPAVFSSSLFSKSIDWSKDVRNFPK